MIFKDRASEPTMNAWEYVFYAAATNTLDLIEHLAIALLPKHPSSVYFTA
jgi:hypothetical protein